MRLLVVVFTAITFLLTTVELSPSVAGSAKPGKPPRVLDKRSSAGPSKPQPSKPKTSPDFKTQWEFGKKWGVGTTMVAASVLAESQLSFAHDLSTKLGESWSRDPWFKKERPGTVAPHEKLIVNPKESSVFLHYPVFQRRSLRPTPPVGDWLSSTAGFSPPQFALYSALPQTPLEYRKTFDREPTQREVIEINRANEKISSLNFASRNKSDESFTQFIRNASDPFIVIIGHNERGRIRLPSGQELKLEDVARSCAEMAALCFVLACEAAQFVPPGTVAAVDRPISIAEAVIITSKLINAARAAAAVQHEHGAKFEAGASEVIRVFGQDNRAYAVYVAPVGHEGPGVVALNILCGGQSRLNGVPCNSTWGRDVVMVKGPTLQKHRP